MPHLLVPDRDARPAARGLLKFHPTVGQKWRFKRDAVIYAAHRLDGFSQRWLADVFDLPRSRIAAIVARFDARYGGQVARNGPKTERRRIPAELQSRAAAASGRAPESGRAPGRG